MKAIAAFIDRLLIAFLLVASFPAYAERRLEMHNGHQVVAGEIIVKFSGNDSAAVSRAVMASGAVAAEPLASGRAVYLFRGKGRNTRAMLESLRAHDRIEYAEPNYLIQVSAVPNDVNLTQQWALANSGQPILGVAGKAGADIGAAAAWDVTTGSAANVAAVIDTGVDHTHPDLAANMWSAPSSFTVSVNGTAITCPAGSHGFNAITNACVGLDDHGHGTHVGGTIGAAGNNSMGVSGVAWTTRIMSLKILAADGSGTAADAVKAIDFAIQAKLHFGAAANVRVMSASWGGSGFSQALSDAIARANGSDILFVTAAGNSGTNNDSSAQYPANLALPNVISVAATDNADLLASFSNWGAGSVHLGAPGVSILSTAPGGGYAWMSGTSMATPHVSGAAMLILSKCAANTAALRSLILSNTDPVASLSGRTTTGGRLNVRRALAACAAPASGFQPIRVNAGGPALTDSAGRVWAADTGYVAGNAFSTTVAVSGADPAGLYQTERWNYGKLQYRFVVPDGNYSVRLKFAEIYPYTSLPGQRVFDIAINGQTVASRFDPVVAAGGASRAVDRTFTVAVTGGTLLIDLNGVVENPKINGIEITAAAAPAPAPAPAPVPPPAFTPVRVNTGGPAFTDSSGQLWAADTGYSAGYSYGVAVPIANTTSPALYQSERWNSGSLRYRFAVPAGSYTVRLKFAEIYYSTPGSRVFNIIMNGRLVESGFDIVSAAGGPQRAIDQVYTVSANTEIAIELTAVIENPKISAIEITGT